MSQRSDDQIEQSAQPRSAARVPKDLAGCRGESLVSLAAQARESSDPLLAGRCLEAANNRRSRTHGRVMEALFPGCSLTPVLWLPAARDVAEATAKSTDGNHHLYVILLDGFSKDSRYGVYVGESRYRPERRFSQHKAGIRAAGVVRRIGRCLLPCLYEHLNPLSRSEAKLLEGALADALRRAGVVVRGGH